MALYSVHSLFAVFLFSHGIATVKSQACDSCFADFNTGFSDLQATLEKSVGAMLELNMDVKKADDGLKQCTGVTVGPISVTGTRSMSNPPSGVPLSTRPPAWVTSSIKTPSSGQNSSWVQLTTIPNMSPQSTTRKQFTSEGPARGSTLPPGVSTTEKSSTDTRLILGIVLGAGFGCLLLLTLFCWCMNSRSSGINSLQSLAQKPIGYGQFPPVQERNPYVFRNRYYEGALFQ